MIPHLERRGEIGAPLVPSRAVACCCEMAPARWDRWQGLALLECERGSTTHGHQATSETQGGLGGIEEMLDERGLSPIDVERAN